LGSWQLPSQDLLEHPRRELIMRINTCHKLICFSSITIFLLILSSCRQIEPSPSGTSVPVVTPRSGEVGKDEIGEYTVVSEQGNYSDDGFVLRIEERAYEILSKSRFIVTQSNLGLEAQSIGIKDINVFFYQGNTQISSNNINMAALLKTASNEVSSLASDEVVFSSELYEIKYDSFLDEENLTQRPCGVVKLDYVDETFYPIVLDTCYRPSNN
jgi:hypothetical protein